MKSLRPALFGLTFILSFGHVALAQEADVAVEPLGPVEGDARSTEVTAEGLDNPSASAPTDRAAERDAEAALPPWQPPKHRLFYRNQLISRTNPSGLRNGFELAYRFRLFDSDSVLFRDSYVGVALKPMITPAFTRIGISAQAQPLAVLYLEASWSWIAWYGVLGHPRTYPDPSGDYSDTGLAEATEAQGEPDAAGGWELDLIAELRAKVGPVVIRNRLTAMRSELTQAEPNALFYDPLYDLLRPRSGWSLMNDADLLVYLLDEHLIVGARYSLGVAFWPGDLGTEATHRLGPLLAYRFFIEPGAAFDAPTAIALVQWHLEHPYRAGADVSQAIPYIVLGFAFQGDLL